MTNVTCSCHGNGQCLENNICTCDSGWVGVDANDCTLNFVTLRAIYIANAMINATNLIFISFILYQTIQNQRQKRRLTSIDSASSLTIEREEKSIWKNFTPLSKILILSSIGSIFELTYYLANSIIMVSIVCNTEIIMQLCLSIAVCFYLVTECYTAFLVLELDGSFKNNKLLKYSLTMIVSITDILLVAIPLSCLINLSLVNLLTAVCFVGQIIIQFFILIIFVTRMKSITELVSKTNNPKKVSRFMKTFGCVGMFITICVAFMVGLYLTGIPISVYMNSVLRPVFLFLVCCAFLIII